MPLASLDTSAGGKYEMYQPDTLEGKNNLAIAQEDGTLLLSIKPADGSLNPNSVFSMNEIILMDRSNQSLLIYIPEIGGTESDTNERYKWDNDGDIQMIKYFYRQTMVQYIFVHQTRQNMSSQDNNQKTSIMPCKEKEQYLA